MEQVLSKFDNKEGHFLVRESRSIDDAYTLSVCHNNKVMHYRIVRHEDGTYSFKDPDRTERDSTLDQTTQPYEYEKFPTLHDLIKSYHQKAVSVHKESIRLCVGVGALDSVIIIREILYIVV